MSRTIVIIGGGAIGCCTGYYLTKHPRYDRTKDSIILLESDKIASGSSGKGGGLLAGWAEPECLALPSFSLHQELADKHEGQRKWGYRRVTCADCTFNTAGRASSNISHGLQGQYDTGGCPDIPEDLHWIQRGSVITYQPVGTEEDTAQCDPLSFTKAIFEEACVAGMKLIQGTAVEIEACCTNEARIAVSYIDSQQATKRSLLAMNVIVAAGPWSSAIVPEASISGARCHSLILRPDESFSNNLLFLDVTYSPMATRNT